jgi:hypothetical protein
MIRASSMARGSNISKSTSSLWGGESWRPIVDRESQLGIWTLVIWQCRADLCDSVEIHPASSWRGAAIGEN